MARWFWLQILGRTARTQRTVSLALLQSGTSSPLQCSWNSCFLSSLWLISMYRFTGACGSVGLSVGALAMLDSPLPLSVLQDRAGVACRTSNPGLKESAASRHSESPRRKSSILVSLRTHMNSSITAFKVGSFWRSESAALRQREYAELLRGRKLARSLAILLSAFAICWAPYCLFTIVLSTYPRTERPKSVWYSIAFWLQWFNSFVNPFLYPLCHRRFQKAFWKILCVTKQPALSQNQSVSSWGELLHECQL